jgi:murein DD-endopeptidase MepM/ murein hydrolase activator NlpD
MARIKYTYDTESCRYERVKKSWLDISLNSLGYLSAAMVIAVVIVMGYNMFFESETTQILKKENDTMKKHYTSLHGELVNVEQVIAALKERDTKIYKRIYEADPIPADQEGKLASVTLRELIKNGWDNEEYVEKAKAKIDHILQRPENTNLGSINRLIIENREKLASLPAIQPVSNPDLSKLASGFGMRINPFHKGRVKHHGIDFAAHRGEPVLATGAGKVISIKENVTLETGYGNYIEIDHGYGYVTKYAHLEKVLVRQGQEVKRGDQIATVGSSGGSVAPHVHYEVIKDKEKIDPIHFLISGLDDHQFRDLLKRASQENQAFD